MNSGDLLLKSSVLGFVLGLVAFVFLVCATVWFRRNRSTRSIWGMLAFVCFWTIPASGAALAFGLVREVSVDREGVITAVGISPVVRPAGAQFMALATQDQVRKTDEVASFFGPEQSAQFSVFLAQKQVLAAQAVKLDETEITMDKEVRQAMASLDRALLQVNTDQLHTSDQLAMLQEQLALADRLGLSTVKAALEGNEGHRLDLLTLLHDLLYTDAGAPDPVAATVEDVAWHAGLIEDVARLSDTLAKLNTLRDELERERARFERALEQDIEGALEARSFDKAVLANRIEWLDAQVAALQEAHQIRAPFDAEVIFRDTDLKQNGAGQLVLALKATASEEDQSSGFLIDILLPDRRVSQLADEPEGLIFEMNAPLEARSFRADIVNWAEPTGARGQQIVTFQAKLTPEQIATVLKSTVPIRAQLNETFDVWQVAWIKRSAQAFVGATLLLLLLSLFSRLRRPRAKARQASIPSTQTTTPGRVQDSARTAGYVPPTAVLENRADMKVASLAQQFRLALLNGNLEPALVTAIDWTIDRHPSPWLVVLSLSRVLAEDAPELRSKLEKAELAPSLRRRANAILTYAESGAGKEDVRPPRPQSIDEDGLTRRMPSRRPVEAVRVG